MIVLRPARMDDADLLWRWRNDPSTRGASHHTGPVSRMEHMRWLAQSLANVRRKLFVGLVGGRPVGTSRIDDVGGVSLLSWTVAPEWRGHGYGAALIGATIALAKGTIQAEIKAENIASRKAAERAGLHLMSERDGVCLYGRSN